MAKKPTIRERAIAFDQKNRQRVKTSTPQALFVRAIVSGAIFGFAIFVMDKIWPVDTPEKFSYYAGIGLVFGLIFFGMTMVEKYMYPKLKTEKKNVKRPAKR